jgi:hypothetical protein
VLRQLRFGLIAAQRGDRVGPRAVSLHGGRADPRDLPALQQRAARVLRVPPQLDRAPVLPFEARPEFHPKCHQTVGEQSVAAEHVNQALRSGRRGQHQALAQLHALCAQLAVRREISWNSRRQKFIRVHYSSLSVGAKPERTAFGRTQKAAEHRLENLGGVEQRLEPAAFFGDREHRDGRGDERAAGVERLGTALRKVGRNGRSCWGW